MYLFYEVKYSIKEGLRAEFVQALKANGIGEKSRAETGCRMYEYIVPTEDRDTLRLCEIWESKDCQKAHTETEHFKMLAALKQTYVDATSIDITEIEEDRI